jgi:hypothetical protein
MLTASSMLLVVRSAIATTQRQSQPAGALMGLSSWTVSISLEDAGERKR